MRESDGGEGDEAALHYGPKMYENDAFIPKT